jgi:hypothetical protein
MSIRRAYAPNIFDIQVPIISIRDFNGFPQEKVNIQVENESKYDMGNFPHNLKELFWTKKGEAGGEPWYAIGQLNTGLYFFFTASTPSKEKLFQDGTGYIQIYIAMNFDNLIQFVLSEPVYKLYVSETR